MRRLDNLVKRQKEFGDLLLSSDIKEVPICGMSFGTVDLPKRTVSCTDNQFISVSSTRCNFTASIFIEKYKIQYSIYLATRDAEVGRRGKGLA